MRIRFLGDRKTGWEVVPAEGVFAVGIRPGCQGGKIIGEQTARYIFAFGEPNQHAIHIGDAVRSVRLPDQQALAVGSLPPERSGEVLSANSERNRAAGVVVGDREIA